MLTQEIEAFDEHLLATAGAWEDTTHLVHIGGDLQTRDVLEAW